MEYLIQNWQQVYDDTYYLFEKIKNDGFLPDIIVGIARGGWIPARLLADFFSLKQTANIKVEAYQMIGQIDVEAKITQDVNTPVEDRKILVVDDIADTGTSLEVVIDNLRERKVSQMKIATLYYKPHSTVIPDYFINETDDWVIFPWEIYESVNEFIQLWGDEGLTEDQIINRCKSIGLPAGMINSYFSSL